MLNCGLSVEKSFGNNVNMYYIQILKLQSVVFPLCCHLCWKSKFWLTKSIAVNRTDKIEWSLISRQTAQIILCSQIVQMFNISIAWLHLMPFRNLSFFLTWVWLQSLFFWSFTFAFYNGWISSCHWWLSFESLMRHQIYTFNYIKCCEKRL